jgi:putative addiction module component (TIGR02574 family)
MKSAIEKIRKTALALSSAERSSLIHDLILSLDDESNYNLSPEYEKEIQRRIKKVKNGKAKGQSPDSIFLEIERKFQ